MKKMFLAAVLLITAISTNAQEAKKGDFNVGITAGAGLSTMRIEDPYDLKDPEGITHIQGGLTFDYTFVNNFFMEFGLTYQRKGYKMDGNGYESNNKFEIDEETKTTVHYMVVPITLNYRINLGDFGLIPQVGPYVGFGLAGKNITTYNLELEDASMQQVAEKMLADMRNKAQETNVFDNENSNRVDFGFRFGLGMAFSPRVKFTIGYDLGVLDLYRGDNIDYKTKHSTLFGTLTFYFNGKHDKKKSDDEKSENDEINELNENTENSENTKTDE